jgi:uncharacterized protein (TIGR02444 family)
MSEAGTSGLAESPFWRFSLHFYAAPGVAPACLALQDEAEVDVNLLLFLLFLATEGRAVDPAGVRTLDERIAPWREAAVAPLRAVRRGLKAGVFAVPHGASEQFRGRIKRVELEAERIEQQLLEESERPAPAIGLSREAIARANIAAYGATGKTLPQAPVAAIIAAFQSLKL